MRVAYILVPLFFTTTILSAQLALKDLAQLDSRIPTDSAELFGDGIISTHLNEYNITFSPKVDMLLFTIANNTNANRFFTIFLCKKRGGRWSKPVIAPFSGQYSDADPFFAPDGKGVYFISTRPTSKNHSKADFDIWFVNYEDQNFGAPIHLGDTVNSNNDELYPTVSKNGNLYFSTENGATGYDLMVSTRENNRFQKSVALSDSINTNATEFDAFIAPDESYIIYTNMGAKDNLGSGDLYISFKKGNYWTAGKNLGKSVNTIHMEQCPIVTGDGQYLFFTTFRDSQPYNFVKPVKTNEYLEILNSPLNGLGNIYWINLGSIIEKLNNQQ